jgi:SAM-dependent methyltransferase
MGAGGQPCKRCSRAWVVARILCRFTRKTGSLGTRKRSLRCDRPCSFLHRYLPGSCPPPKMCVQQTEYENAELTCKLCGDDADFAQRTRYFSRYDEGCLLDEEGWYSVMPEAIATQIAERCRCDVVLDAFCGAGGNAIAFARTCQHGTSPLSLYGFSFPILNCLASLFTCPTRTVIALDTSPMHLALARHNAALHGLAERIEFVLADFRTFAASRMVSHATSESGSKSADAGASAGGRKIDVVFLSPPWGGPECLTEP